jgi:Protein of unknown function (DUF2505)
MLRAMKNISLTHVVDCDIDTFWSVFLDAEYNKKLYLEGLGFKSFEPIELTATSRRMKGVPKMNVPGAVAKLLGDSFGYEENGTLDKATNTYTWKMTPNTMVDKLFTKGSVKIEAAGEGKVRRTSSVSIEAKMFGVGGLLESTAEGEMRASMEKEAAFMNRWVKK